VLADELERNNEKLKVQVQELLDIQAEVCRMSRSPTFPALRMSFSMLVLTWFARNFSPLLGDFDVSFDVRLK
jgi:hypothetical protein